MHTLEDVEYTIESFKAVQDKLSSGQYKSETIAQL